MTDIQKILARLDALFDRQALEEIEPYLTEQLQAAYASQDYHACITIMNELIGFFRDTSQYQKALDQSEQVLMLFQQLGYEGTLAHATTMLNVANALRAAGFHQESLAMYQQVFPIYQKHLEPLDERIASLYNNLSLLYQEMEDYPSAVSCLMKALDIISKGTDEIKIAVTHSNLGASLLQMGEIDQAVYHLQKALSIFGKYKEKDFHYSAAAAAMGQACMILEDLPKARMFYLDALYEQQKHCGKSEAFYRILNNLHLVERKMGVPLTKEPEDRKKVVSSSKEQLRGLDLSWQFYEQVAKKELFDRFGSLTDRMAIGRVGEGSECFGFDDALSHDHDFGPDFCIWLNKKDYDMFGVLLQAWYDALPMEYRGFSRMQLNASLEKRVGVWCMDDFFKQYTGYATVSGLTYHELLSIPDHAMATILNGRMFHDPSGMFRQAQNAFYEAFTEDIWNIKIAQSLIALGKYGQYNYPRCMKRKDYVTAQMILYKYVEELLKFVHYINHVFPPYYKWLKKSAGSMKKLAVLADLTEALADFADAREAWKEQADGAEDRIIGTIEIIAGLIVEEGSSCGLWNGMNIPSEELFLEVYGKALLMRSVEQVKSKQEQKKLAAVQKETRNVTVLPDPILEHNTKEALADHIVSMEWKAFDEVQNLGGRADCQDNWGTFSIMRKSQYLAWEKPLLISWIKDFRKAKEHNWNLITEKYARMMQSTDPEAYAQIASTLPILSEQTKAIIEQIVALQVAWMEQFAAAYPNMAYNSRVIHTEQDSKEATSYETYLRGELSTYSPETLELYGRFIVSLFQRGENLAKNIMTNTALLYGYRSLEDAESRLGK